MVCLLPLSLSHSSKGCSTFTVSHECELDVCRQDVETLRRLVMLREELLVKQHRAGVTTSNSKRNVRSVEDTKEEQKRYKQAVEEKKGSHIYNYPSVLLDELHSLREADKNTLQQKVRAVGLLRQGVEKITGELEVLKGVVEEGLRKKRARTPNTLIPW